MIVFLHKIIMLSRIYVRSLLGDSMQESAKRHCTHSIKRSPETFIVKVTNVGDGETAKFTLSPETTLEQVKIRIEEEFGVSPWHQLLTTETSVLDDDSVLLEELGTDDVELNVGVCIPQLAHRLPTLLAEEKLTIETSALDFTSPCYLPNHPGLMLMVDDFGYIKLVKVGETYARSMISTDNYLPHTISVIEDTSTSNTYHVIVRDGYNRLGVLVLSLVISRDTSSGQLSSVRSIGYEEEDNMVDTPIRIDSPMGGTTLLCASATKQTLLMVANTQHCVFQYDFLTGKFMRVFAGTKGQEGTGNGRFKDPMGIAVYADQVFVCDRGNSRVQVFDNNGTYLRQFGTHGKGNGQFEGPASIIFDAFGHVLVTDTTTRLQVFTNEGHHVCTRDYSEFGMPVSWDGPPECSWGPNGDFALCKDGRTYLWLSQ